MSQLPLYHTKLLTIRKDMMSIAEKTSKMKVKSPQCVFAAGMWMAWIPYVCFVSLSCLLFWSETSSKAGNETRKVRPQGCSRTWTRTPAWGELASKTRCRAREWWKWSCIIKCTILPRGSTRGCVMFVTSASLRLSQIDNVEPQT